MSTVTETPQTSVAPHAEPEQPATVEQPSTAEQPAAPAEQPAVLLNTIVNRCMKAYRETYAAEKARGLSSHDAGKKAKAAYLEAMPYLTAAKAIRAYIACVAHGMVLEIIRKDDGSKLLYAAKMALNAIPRELKSPGRPKG